MGRLKKSPHQRGFKKDQVMPTQVPEFASPVKNNKSGPVIETKNSATPQDIKLENEKFPVADALKEMNTREIADKL